MTSNVKAAFRKETFLERHMDWQVAQRCHRGAKSDLSSGTGSSSLKFCRRRQSWQPCHGADNQQQNPNAFQKEWSTHIEISNFWWRPTCLRPRASGGSTKEGELETKMLHDERPSAASNGRTLGKQPGAVKAKQLGPRCHVPRKGTLNPRAVGRFIFLSRGSSGSACF